MLSITDQPDCIDQLLSVREPAPLGPLSLASLCELWRETRLFFTLKTSHSVVADIELVIALRSAIGRHIHDSKDGTTNTLWRYGFEHLQADAQGRAIPRPFVMSIVQLAPDCIELCITFFGFADCMAEAFATAVEKTASGVLSMHNCRIPLLLLKESRRRSESLFTQIDPKTVHLHFSTPFFVGWRMRSGNQQSLLSSLLFRVHGLARWHGYMLGPKTISSIKDSIASTTIDDAGLNGHAWSRRSQRNGGHTIPMQGYTGLLSVTTLSEDLVLLIALGQQCHAGAKTALGMGCYRAHWFDERGHRINTV